MSNFKVIIVGAGPVGLTAGIVLSRAGIDFVILESRHQIVGNGGANLVLQPNGLRILNQLGLLGNFCGVSSALNTLKRCDHNGHNIGDLDTFRQFQENHGIASRVASRPDITQVLYDALPASARAKTHANKRVCSITYDTSSATVHCTDGSSYTGSIIIGADGAHSEVRRQMRTLALANLSTLPSQVNEEHPFLATFRCLWIRFPTQADFRPGDCGETHGVDVATQAFAGEETSVVGVYERLPRPATNRLRFDPEDEKELIQRCGSLPITKQLTIKDIYDSRVSSGLVSLEEGVVSNWSWGRIVLVGDAAHKFTPSTGAGCNYGMADVVVLANELARIVAPETSTAPSIDDITQAFKEYQDKRFQATVTACAGSGRATAMATWSSLLLWFVDVYIASIPWLLKRRLSNVAPKIAATPALDFIPDEGLPEGKFPWVKNQGML